MTQTIELLTDYIPKPGECYEISPGILWIRMPLPFRLNHINLWLIEEVDGWVLIDSGINDDSTKAYWQKIFNNVLKGKAITRLICTHAHPDHIGLGGWIQEKYGTKLLITREEWLFGRLVAAGNMKGEKSYYDYLLRIGCKQSELKDYEAHIATADQLYYDVPFQFERLRDGSEVKIAGKSWNVIVGLGHSQEHACLYCPELEVLIAGDQVLPKITPTIMVQACEPEENPLLDFLESNKKLRDLPEFVVVLPSHNVPFTGLNVRLDQYIIHHMERLNVVLEACVKPLSGMEVARFLFPQDLDSHGKFFAVGETMAHIKYLEYEGKLSCTSDGDGIERYIKA